MEKKADT